MKLRIPIRHGYCETHRLAAVVLVAMACGLTGTLANAQSGDLIFAAQRGDLPTVNALLQSGADVNTHKSPHVATYTTPLIQAAVNGHSDVVRALLAANADVNAEGIGNPQNQEGRTALQIASSAGHLEVVQALLAAKADVNATLSDKDDRTALVLASQNGHLEVVQALLAAGADVNCKSRGCRAPLVEASDRAHLEVVKVLLAAKADPNPEVTILGQTLLVRAITQNHLEIARALVEAGTSVVTGGVTPLMAAAGKSGPGSLELVQAILAAHADVNIRSHARVRDTAFETSTPLGMAASSGSVDIVQALLDPGRFADVNAKQGAGNTPLIIASAKGRTDVVRLLLAAKADVNTRNDDGATALTLALQNNHPEVADLLKRAAAAIPAR